MVEILLKHGANPNIRQTSGLTAWQHALSGLNGEATKQKEISVQTSQPAKSYAVLDGWAHAIQAFLEHNADPRATIGKLVWIA